MNQYLDCTLLDFARGLRYYAEQESRKLNPDTHLIAVLQRAACVGWENIQIGKSAISPTPADEVAQRARAAAEEIVASISVNDFRNIQSFNRYDRLTDVILKHFTATDGTCTWTWTGTERVTACGAQTRDFGLVDFKFCAFCGKPLVEAAKESSNGA